MMMQCMMLRGVARDVTWACDSPLAGRGLHRTLCACVRGLRA